MLDDHVKSSALKDGVQKAASVRTCRCLLVAFSCLLGWQLLCLTKTSAATPTIHDCGKVSIGTECRHSFTIPNRAKTSLTIQAVKASSRELQVLSYPVAIAPSQQGMLELRWLPTKPGSIEEEVTLETAESELGVFKYRVKGTATGAPKAGQEGRPQLAVPVELITRKLRTRDPAILTPIEAIASKSKGALTPTLVDIREPSSFEKFHIPGSINFPLFAVKSKRFLKNRPLVLVTEGYAYEHIEAECRHLRQLGFMAFILDGGLAAWKAKNGQLVGDALAQEQLKNVPPSVFFTERHFDNWVVLDASTSRRQEVAYLLPEAVPVMLSGNNEKIVGELKAIQTKNRKRPFLAFLVLNDDGTGYEKYEKVLHQAGLTQTFFLKGGIDGYRSYLEQQATLLQPKDESKKTLKKCASCP